MSHQHKSTDTPIDIPWKESRFHSHTTQEQDELEENDDMFDMYVTSRISEEYGLIMDGKFIHLMRTYLLLLISLTYCRFADPDPYETFEFEFGNKNDDDQNKDHHHITLHGHKQENGQTLHSTGLTLWRASELLCEYLVEHQELVANKRVVEVRRGRLDWIMYACSRPTIFLYLQSSLPYLYE